ncbi:MAG: hypothetical protein ACRELV_11165, partial [Longimicrobiales bacterium]
MAGYKRFIGFLTVLMVGFVPLACGDDAEDRRAALEQDELSRELDLALGGDSLTTTFEDTAAGVEPEPTRGAAAPQAPPRRAPDPE